MTWVAVATEDQPSEEIAVRLVDHFGGSVFQRFRKDGFGYLKSSTRKFAEVARNFPVLLLTDLDSCPCPGQLRSEWCGDLLIPDDFHFRVAVRECEAWLLADREQLGDYLGVHPRHFPEAPEMLPDPKAELLKISRRAPRRIRVDMVRDERGVLFQGLGYSARLAEFARDFWRVDVAAERAPSLARAIARLGGARFVCDCCN